MKHSLRQNPKRISLVSKLNGKQRLQESAFIIVMLLAIFLTVALFSHDPNDPSWSQTAWDGPMKNAAGGAGAWVADSFFFTFGLQAYPLPFLLALGGWFVFRRDKEQELNYHLLSAKILGGVVLLLTSCALATLNFDDFGYFSSGGVIGDVVIMVGLPMLNQLGTTLVLLFFWAAGFTLLTGISWLTIADVIGELVLNSLAKVVNSVRGERSVIISATGYELNGNTRTHIDPLFVSSSDELAIAPPPYKIEKPESALRRIYKSVFQRDPDFSRSVRTEPILFAELDIAEGQAENHHAASRFSSSASHNTSANDIAAAAAKTELPPQIARQQETFTDILNRADEADLAIDLQDSILYSDVGDTARKGEKSFYAAGNAAQEALSSQMDAQAHTVAAPFSGAPAVSAPTTLAPDADPLLDKAVFDMDEPALGSGLSAACDAETVSKTMPAFTLSHEMDSQVAAETEISVGQLTQIDAALEPEQQFTTVEPPILEEIYAAVAKREPALHPFLVKNEPNLPKPREPFPTLDLLEPAKSNVEPVDDDVLQQKARTIEERLAEYKIKVTVKGIYPGPVITRFELELAPGVKVSRIMGLSKDIARSLATSSVRVVDAILGKPYIGLELPNAKRETVFMSQVVGSQRFQSAKSPLSVVLGKDISGEAIVTDLAKAPHMLVAGTTGSGKSVGVNAMIVSMLYKATPEEVRFIMIDPKMLELSVYQGIPHLLSEVVTDMKDASNALRWCVAEMERRYKLMSMLGVRNIVGFNDKINEAAAANMPIPDPMWTPSSMNEPIPMLEKLPYIVVIIDEFADLMMVVGKKVEELIARLAQKARAAGIHLVLATQRPSVDVITGLIKANIPTRVAFTVSTKIDSRTILDQAGAESLLGMGDMLFIPNGSNQPVRVHGAFVSDDEVHRVVSNWKARGKPNYIKEIVSSDQGRDGLLPGEMPLGGDGDELDVLFDQAVEFVTSTRKASVSAVQRRFKIGYNRASRIVEQLEVNGIISASGHNANREVIAPPPIEA